MDAAPQSSVLSLTNSAALEEEVQDLRAVLRDVFLDEGRRKELRVFRALERLLVFVRRWLDADGAAHGVDEQSRFAVLRYAQDVFAALLFLMDGENLETAYQVADCPEPLEEDVEEAEHDTAHVEAVPHFYVSARQRAYCARWFFILCARLPTRHVILSLYPLLDTPLVATRGHSSAPAAVQQNHIAPGLLRHQMPKRRLLSQVLTGVFLGRADGVQGLLQTLVLSSDVPSDLVFEACQHVVTLVTAPVDTVWLVQQDARTVICVCHTASERRIELLSPQLLPLFTRHAHDDVPLTADDSARGGSAGVAPPSALARLGTQSSLPAETIENRLHLFLTMLSNAMVVLPAESVDSAPYRRAYRDFFFFNKHFLTPAFGTLSLRRKPPVDVHDVVASLFRLYTVADGATLGASARSFLTVFETVGTGFLELTALDDRHSDASLHAAVALVWKCLDALDAHADEIATSLVRSALLPTPYSFAVPDSVARRVEYVPRPPPPASMPAALGAMVSAVFSAPASGRPLSPTLQSAVVRAMAVECRSALYGVSALPQMAASHESDHADALLAAIEGVCMGSPSEAIFGTDATLVTIFELLITVLPLSPLCFQWSLEMAASVGSAPELVAPFVDDVHEAADCARRASRLVRTLRTFAGLVAHVQKTRTPSEDVRAEEALSGALRAAEVVVATLLGALEKDLAATSLEAPRSVGRVHELQLRWEALTSRVASAVETQAQSALSIATMELAASVEDAAYSVHADDRPALVPTAQRAVAVLLHVLLQSADVCACGHAIRALTWLGMYRFDAIDSRFLGEAVCSVLLTASSSSPAGTVKPGVTVASNTAAGTMAARVAKASRPQLARFKCRILDVLLSWCDYDQDGQTLRNIDSVCRSTRGLGLFDVLAAQCVEGELPVVQVSSLHCLGHYIGAVYPRVSLTSVCGLCQDVFRHTRVEMAKAACASMLSQIARTLQEQGTLSAVADVDMEEVLKIANAMTAYHFPYTAASPASGRPTDDKSTEEEEAAEHVLHGEVIREKGREVVRLLGVTANNLFIQELHGD